MSGARHLILRLEAPLAAFGGVAIDQVGITRDFPAASMLTGLIANALGYRRTETAAHQALQDRLVFAARREHEPVLGRLTDTQNAQLAADDKGWTTFGAPEGRAGASYGAPHRRRRDYHADVLMTVALRLDPAETDPTLERIEAALDRPARPLFLGRKPCLPSAPLYRGFVMAETAGEALRLVPSGSPGAGASERLRALWPVDEAPVTGAEIERIYPLPDIRNWTTGLHGGTRMIAEGSLMPAEAAP
ncbi:type I-E CRISPR-associated protein Cas5/CasD [Amorphus sp. 3PC139-8]|uniref:type I-E CRISPR-associated protein Cas5/CasD n=1 Tax=Amorphus sp. 3PC139-8 TaxID=2735676 RepID=UPI00345D8A8A